MLARGRIVVDDIVATDINQVIEQFSHVSLDGQTLQANNPVYVMLNKPAGVVSATKDEQHRTVIDLLERADRNDLHIVGRLDFNSTGLLLLSNDGRWSRQLTAPNKKVTKLYRVQLTKPLQSDYIEAFAEGMYFPFEGITTRPAKLRIISPHLAEVELIEGRYHQIKRMFGRFDNKVLALHRTAIGGVILDPNLRPGQSRELTAQEVASQWQGPSHP
jgi:16S rRNA pseudouridine516 synthase